MLAVAVDLDAGAIAIAIGKPDSGLNRASDSEIDRQSDAAGPFGRFQTGRIARAVIDDQDICEIGAGANVLDNTATDAASLKQGTMTNSVSDAFVTGADLLDLP